ncbi:unnamed protein product [Macrosiphum euphorbiae]|uniref:Uncharacterized protein n=1 Tax=Macrosiphum euphorbiae TaxID=13131 RepID=A0AAV0VPQ4_9HEMI|nr:unnamed protein product [Macrosiphum euphorbiae]
MEMRIQIPLGKLQAVRLISKRELTNIDRYLDTNQKKRVAKFFRDEAAKRNKYLAKPNWTLPETLQMVNKDGYRAPSPEILSDDWEPTWTMPECQLAAEKVYVLDTSPETTPDHTEKKETSEGEEEKGTPSSMSTVVTDDDEIEPVHADILDIAASPLPESDSGTEQSDPEEESSKTEMMNSTIKTLWDKQQGSYHSLKEGLFTAKKFIKGFEEVSKTQMKKQIYREKLKQIKALKRQHQQ